MEKYKEISKYLISLLIGGIIVAILLKKCGDSNIEKVVLYENQDTIKYYRDKEGKLHAKIRTLEVENIKNFTSLKTKDKEILELQALVKKYEKELKDGGSATNFGTETHVTKTTSTTVVKIESQKSDTNRLQGKSLVCNPTYSTGYSDQWLQYSITMNKDSTNFDFNSINKYSVVIGSERKNKWKFWTKKESFVDVTNENPYDRVKTLRSFTVKQKKERFSIGIQAGYGLTIRGLSPYIGVGGQFKLISL